MDQKSADFSFFHALLNITTIMLSRKFGIFESISGFFVPSLYSGFNWPAPESGTGRCSRFI